MPMTISLNEASTRLPDLIASLAPDEEVVITDHQRPVARLVGGAAEPQQRPGPGLCKGMITIHADDEEHLADFKEYMP